jgi:predicted transcriptional regulator
MSRPRVYDEPRVATAIRLPTSLHEELQSVASERDVSVNFLVTRAVSTFLAQLPSAGNEMERDVASKGSQKGKKHRRDR